MKNLKQKIILCAGIILTGLIAACSSPFTEPTNESTKLNAGTGKVLISIAGSNGRTILPAIDSFSRYALEVSGAGNNLTVPADLSGITGHGVSMTLTAGQYTVTVKAYRASGANEYLAAQGNKQITVTSGSETVPVVIDLKPFIGEEKGFFSYHITLPSEAVTATLNLKAAAGSYDEQFNLMNSAVSSTPIELPAGYYNMFIILAKSNDETGEYAAVHIYSGMETKAVIDLNNVFSLINLETLTHSIETAENELANTKISDDGTDVLIEEVWVTQDAVDALKTALNAAQDIVADPPNKQKPVNTARLELEAALETFADAAQQGTKNLEPLKTLIETAENELTNAKISDDGTDILIGEVWVTQDAVDALKTALETAQAVVDNPSAKQSQVVAAQKELEEALTTFASAAQLKKPGAEGWTGLITEVETPVTFTVNGSDEWTLSVPLANTNVNGTYTVSKGTVTLIRESAVYAVGTLFDGDNTLTIALTTAILGTHTVTLTKGTAAPGAADIEYLYSGIWVNTGTTPVITYISSSKWTFSLPNTSDKADGSFRVYDRKAAFFKTDGTFFAVGKVATEQAGLEGNTLTIYPVTGGSYALTLNPYPNPFIGNWQGGDTIPGTLYVNVTTWSLENEGVTLASGEYVWDGNSEVHFISNGMRFATGTINDDKNALTVVVPSMGAQVFTLIPSPFIGNWKGSITVLVIIKAADTYAAVTSNAYDIRAEMTAAAGGGTMLTNGQYIWRNENGTRRGYFYSNGYSYGTAALSANSNTITVTLTEPIAAPIGSPISTLSLTRQ